jgi:hypothetical protein
MTRPRIKRTFPPPAAWKTMAVGAVYERTFPTWQKRSTFRKNVHRFGHENGKRLRARRMS